MTKEEFDKLKIGDTVQSAYSGLGYTIISGDRTKGFIAVRTMIITNPNEWTCVQQQQ